MYLRQRTPGYPALLAFTGSTIGPSHALFYISLALHFGAIGFIAYVLNVLGLSRGVVWLFICIVLLPPYVESTAWVMTESLAQVIMGVSYCALILWLVNRRQWMFWLYACSATYLAFVRPTYEALTIVVAVTSVVCWCCGWLPGLNLRNLSKSLLVAVAIPVICLAGYASWSYFRCGYFGVSTMSAYVLSHKTASFVEFMPAPYQELRDILVKYRDSYLVAPRDDHTAQNYIYRALPEIRRYYGGDELKVIEALEKANLALIKAKPLSYVNDSLKVLGSYWMPLSV